MPARLAWKLYGQLRRELVGTQRIRAQVIVFKIAFVATAMGLVFTYLSKPGVGPPPETWQAFFARLADWLSGEPSAARVSRAPDPSSVVIAVLIALPAASSLFFDFLIASYTVAIKRIGVYCRTHLEPVLREATGFPAERMLWEEFMATRKYSQWFSLFGIVGLSFISTVVAIALLLTLVPARGISLCVTVGLVVLLGMSATAHRKAGKVGREVARNGEDVRAAGNAPEAAPIPSAGPDAVDRPDQPSP